MGYLEIFDQLEIKQRGIVQTETARVMMIFDEELQTTSTPPTGKLLILLCSAVEWKNTVSVPA